MRCRSSRASRQASPTADALKHLGCSLASYGSIAMYHLVGVTPEAPSAAAAFGARQPKRMMDVTDEAIEGVYRAYDVKDGRADLVVFSGPQLSLFEIQTLAELFAGRRVHSDTQVFLTTNHAIASDARRLGYLDVLETSGVQIMTGVCFYILEDLSGIRLRNNWTNLISNSAKIVNTITAHRFNTILRRTRDCVEAAVTGRVVHGH
jgi:predicted aconitase